MFDERLLLLGMLIFIMLSTCCLALVSTCQTQILSRISFFGLCNFENISKPFQIFMRRFLRKILPFKSKYVHWLSEDLISCCMLILSVCCRNSLQQKMERVVLVIRENSSLLHTRVEYSRMRLSLVLRGLVNCYTQLISLTDS